MPIDVRAHTCYPTPMPFQSKPTNKSVSSRTRTRGFRITHTQDSLLNSPSIGNKASAIVRVLLTLYFNKKIPGIDLLVEAELKNVDAVNEKNLQKFRDMLVKQGAERKNNGKVC
jgi:hypothetical protein